MGTRVHYMDTPEQASREVARAVSQALTAAGISQRTASQQTGIPLNTLSRRLTGKSPFNVTELAFIAELLGITVADLVGTRGGQAA